MADELPITYTQFACIGAGISGIALGAKLKRQLGIVDLRIFEREPSFGGTWYINKYPGCACDIPSALYSYSFKTNPNWTRVLPSATELYNYLDTVVEEHDLLPRMAFSVAVEKAEWIAPTSRWRLRVRILKTGVTFTHESQFLFTATGILHEPRKLDVPGLETFKGPVMHSARWRSDFDLTGKRVVLFGNGCSAIQIVPALQEKVAKLTQLTRSKHYYLPSIDRAEIDFMRKTYRLFPWVKVLQRWILFWKVENDFRMFPYKSGKSMRRRVEALSRNYVMEMAPKKYHDILMPDNFEVGCKRRVFDVGYLNSLHRPNIELTDERAAEVMPEGVRMTSGRVIEADVLVLANGFATNEALLGGINIVGVGGQTVREHWKELGGAEGYNTTAMNGFPNLFMLLGPNTATGHTSCVLATEFVIDYAFRILKPVLGGKATVVEVRRDAEEQYVGDIQTALQKTVFNMGGCYSWYLRHDQSGKVFNSMTYPWSQLHFWWRSRFPIFSDWKYYGRTLPSNRSNPKRKRLMLLLLLTVSLYACRSKLLLILLTVRVRMTTLAKRLPRFWTKVLP